MCREAHRCCYRCPVPAGRSCCPLHGDVVSESIEKHTVGCWSTQDTYSTDECTCPDDATPPLVAASPVPPVVPDSEALDLPDDERAVRAVIYRLQAGEDHVGPEYRAVIYPEQIADFAAAIVADVRDALTPAASGVVPDKPALDLPEPKPGMIRCCKHCAQPCEYPNDHAFWCNACSNESPNASVPAVTDDEAATEKIAGFDSVHDDQCEAEFVPEALASTACDCARRFVADLRSAGFLIVHHTKET